MLAEVIVLEFNRRNMSCGKFCMKNMFYRGNSVLHSNVFHVLVSSMLIMRHE